MKGLLIVALLHAGEQASESALVSSLQRAVAKDDRQAVAALVQYPITIMVTGVRIAIPDAAAFIQNYEAVFTPELVSAIQDRSAVKNQLIDVAATDGAFKITRISAPHGTRGAERPPAPAPAPRASRREPRRVAFAVVQQAAQLSAALAPGQTESFVAYVEKNRLLEARIEGVSGREIVLRVLDQKSGRPLDAKAAEGSRTWIGRVPESADYRIEVTRPASAGDASLPYVLVVRRR